MSVFLRKYDKSTAVEFPLISYGGSSLTTIAAFVAGDVDRATRIYTGGWAVAVWDNPIHVGLGIYRISIAAIDMRFMKLIFCIKDQSSPKVWEDQFVIVETYGHPYAMHQFDLDTVVGGRGVVSVSS